MSDTAARQQAPRVQVYLLGPLRIVVDGRELPTSEQPRNKALLVLQCLLTMPNRRIGEDVLAELFFADSPPDVVRSTIGGTLTAIRNPLGWGVRRGQKRIGADPIQRGHGTIAIQPEAGVWVDADHFEQLLRDARTAEDPYPLLEEASRLYAGDYLPDVRDGLWPQDRRRHLKRLWTELQFQLAQHREQRGDAEGAAVALEAVLRDEACDEQAARALMRLYARTGRRTDALQVYARLVASLKDELGVEPSRETVETWQQVSADTPPPAIPPAAPTVRSELRPSGPPSPAGGRTEDRLGPAQFTPSYPFPMPERLVGRESELAFLEKFVHQGRTGARVALVGAPAGTGKSALLGALVQRARRAGYLCLVGGGYEDGDTVPLGPFHDALVDYLLWQPAERVRSELAGALSDLALLVPELQYHLGLSAPPSPDRASDNSRIFGSILVYLLGLTERHPVLLCLEDLHAADAATLALIERLARQMARQRLVIIGTFRTEELRPGRPLSDLVTALRRRNAEQLDLKPLNRQRSARLVATLLEGQASQRLSDALFSTTEGNPLFLEQLVLALREEGKIDQQDGVWRQIGDVSGVPTIIRDVIGQRLDRLTDGARQTLEMAAVLGQTFEYGGLLAASEHGELLAASEHARDEMRLLEDLDEAFGAQILLETPAGYAFGHALFREVAYTRISPPRRMGLHARAGEALERWAGARAEERAAELAHHFLAGGHSAPMRQKALHYSLEAGRRAAALSAYREALGHFSRACEITEAPGTGSDVAARLDALEGRGQAARNVGVWRICVESLRAFLELSTDSLRRARAREDIANRLIAVGQTADALAECEAGLAELDAADTRLATVGVRLRLQYDLALLYFLAGRYRNLHALAEEMVQPAQVMDHPTYPCMAHMVMAWAHMGQGQVEPAIEQYRLALATAERAGDKIDIAVSHVNLGIQHYRGARFEAARPELEEAIALFREVTSDVRAVNGIQTLSRVWLAQGDLERASELAELAETIVAETEDRWAAECHDLLGTIHLARAQWELAEASFSTALRIRESVGHMAGTVESLLGLGLAYERSGDWTRCGATYRRAVEIAQRMDACPQMVAAQRQLGRFLLRGGDVTGGTCYLQAAATLAETMRHSLEYAPTLLAFAELHTSLHPGQAASLAEAALAAGATVEVRVEGHALASSAYLTLQEFEPAGRHSDEALMLATRLGTPHALGIAYLARGRLEAARGNASAGTTLETALNYFTLARAPYGQALTMQQSANVLEMLHQDPARADALRLDATRLLPTVR